MVAFDGVVRLVDPDFAGDFGWLRSTVDEALRMPSVGVIKDVLPRCLEFISQTMVDGVGGEQPEAAVTVFGVVPGEEVSKVGLCVLKAAEATRVRRRVFDGLEVALRIRVVVGHPRPAVTGQDIQVDQQLGKRLGRHRRTAVLVQGELSWGDALVQAGAGDQPLRSGGRFPGGYHPGDDVAREQIEHHVERVGDPLAWTWQARYVPGPDTVWRGGHNWADVIDQNGVDEAIYAVGYRVFDQNFLIGTGFSLRTTATIWTNAHVVVGLIVALSQLVDWQPIPFAVKSGTPIFGEDTYLLQTFHVHPEYDGTPLSPDIAIFVVDKTFQSGPFILPPDLADDLRVGQPIGTMGFPGEITGFDSIVPIATFKDGTVSALRPYNPITTSVAPANNRMVQHNMDLSAGTSGSPIFDHEGWIIAVNNAGTEKLVIDLNTGSPARVPTGNIGFGIRADEMWDFMATFASAKPARLPKSESPIFPDALARIYRHHRYQPFPVEWNGL